MKKRHDRKRRRSMAARATAAVLAMGILAGCSSGGTATTSAQSAPAATTAAQGGSGVTGPGAADTTPATGTTQPGAADTTPGTGTTQPGAADTSPGTGMTQPGAADTSPGTGMTQPVSTQGQVGEPVFAEQARTLVQERLGEGGVIQEIEYDHEGRRPHYEGEAFLPGKKIEFEVNAQTGEMDKWEEQDSSEYDRYAERLAEIITMDEAADLVIERSGMPDTFVQEIELSLDGTTLEYEGDAYYEGVKYDFEIDAVTGEIKEWEEERSSDWVEKYSNLR